ncbi:MAG: FKBP-type peptidyl-prolyl cis-trans isomerase [Bacteroidetes bacterium]|nr:FKBP-type peptidyl-prolyl cis-trans isomerase [Bacteroidota bacterium]
MKQFFAVFILTSVVIAFSACNNNDNSLEKMRENELVILDDYIQANFPVKDALPSGLYFYEETVGHGDSLIRGGDRVQIFYATYTIDSILIDQSSGYVEGYRFEPLEFIVGTGGVVAGLDEAITYMREGGKADLVINSELAYGQNGSPNGGVSGFSTILMEIEVYKVYPFIVPE